MSQKTLDRIHERVKILNLIHKIEDEQISLELTYAAIVNNVSQSTEETAYEYHDTLQDIELRMSMLEEKYNDLQRRLLSLSQR